MSACPIPPPKGTAAEDHENILTRQPCVNKTPSSSEFDFGTSSSLEPFDNTTVLTLPDNSTTGFDHGSFERFQDTTDLALPDSLTSDFDFSSFGDPQDIIDNLFNPDIIENHDNNHKTSLEDAPMGGTSQKRPRSPVGSFLSSSRSRFHGIIIQSAPGPEGRQDGERPPKKRQRRDHHHQIVIPDGRPGLSSADFEKLAQAFQLFFSDRSNTSLTDIEIDSLATLSRLSNDDVRRFLENSGSVPKSTAAKPQSSIHDRTLDLVNDYIRHASLRGCQPGRRTRKNAGDLCCTSKCGYRTHRVDDFVRHEEIVQPQEFWCCQRCLHGKQPPFITHRKDKFTGHIHKYHEEVLSQQMEEGDDKVISVMDRVREDSRVPYTATFKSTCGFCGQHQPSWQVRNKHVVSHFKGSIAGGRRYIHEWRDPWTEDDDTNGLAPDDGDDWGDSDSDGNNDDGHLPPGDRKGISQEPSYPGEDVDADDGCSWSSGASGCTGFVRGENAQEFYDSNPSSSCPCTEIRNANPHLRLLPTSMALGKGSFASVDKLIDGPTKEEFARKKITPTVLDASAKQRFEMEVRIMKRLDHPNIVRIKDHWCDRTSMNILMKPAAESNMRTILSMRCPWMREQILETMWWWMWLESLASALTYMHARKVRHGDIKPSNILVHESNVYLCDFGVSRQVKTKSSSSSEPPMTPMYAAPEIFSRTRHGRAADIFSLGCVFLELLTVHRLGTLTGFYTYLRDASKKKGQKPSYQSQLYEVMKWISFLVDHTDTETTQVLKMCRSMLNPTASKRPTASQVHKLLSKVLSGSSGGVLFPSQLKGKSFDSFGSQDESGDDGGGMSHLWQQCRVNTPADRNPFEVLFPARHTTFGQKPDVHAQLRSVVHAAGSDQTKTWTWKENNIECHRRLPFRRLLDCDLFGAGESTDSLLPPYDECTLSFSLTPSQRQLAEQSLLQQLFCDSASSGEDPRSRWFWDKSTTYDRVYSPVPGHRSSHNQQSIPPMDEMLDGKVQV